MSLLQESVAKLEVTIALIISARMVPLAAVIHLGTHARARLATLEGIVKIIPTNAPQTHVCMATAQIWRMVTIAYAKMDTLERTAAKMSTIATSGMFQVHISIIVRCIFTPK